VRTDHHPHIEQTDRDHLDDVGLVHDDRTGTGEQAHRDDEPVAS
jgi:hypothetical protein